MPVDHEEMKQIAAATNGEYFAAATADQLKRVYQNIGSDIGYEKADREVTARFAGYGLALAVLAALGCHLPRSKMAVMLRLCSRTPRGGWLLRRSPRNGERVSRIGSCSRRREATTLAKRRLS